MREGSHTLLYHEVGDGEALSGGEAQKAAIAQALYKDTPFVILEPTAALDPVAEAEIYENFNGLVGGKTAIYISHRMSNAGGAIMSYIRPRHSIMRDRRSIRQSPGTLAPSGNHRERRPPWFLAICSMQIQ